MTIPKSFIEQNSLSDGSRVDLIISGKILTVLAPVKPSYRLADLMAEMPNGLAKVEGWDEMPDIGLERL